VLTYKFESDRKRSLVSKLMQRSVVSRALGRPFQATRPLACAPPPSAAVPPAAAAA